MDGRSRPRSSPITSAAGAPDHPQSAEMKARLQALDLHVAGLAISGGGIRSATFALGVIQALAHLKLLRRFDYLSTVSGGGYIGGWLTAWIRRERSFANVELQLAPSRVGPERGPAKAAATKAWSWTRSRRRSSISAPTAITSRPGSGVLTPDTWTILAIYFRNILINLLMLVPATLGLLLAARFLVVLPYVWAAADGPVDVPAVAGWTLVVLVAALALLGPRVLDQFGRAGGAAAGRDPGRRKPADGRRRGPGSRRRPKTMSEARLVQTVVVPIVRRGRAHGVGLPPDQPAPRRLSTRRTRAWMATSRRPGHRRPGGSSPRSLFCTGLVTIALHVLHSPQLRGPDRAKLGKAAVFSGLFGGCLFSLLFVWILFVSRSLDACARARDRHVWPPAGAPGGRGGVPGGGRRPGPRDHEAEREWWAQPECLASDGGRGLVHLFRLLPLRPAALDLV